MQQWMHIFDDSAKLNQTPYAKQPEYHPQNKYYKIIHQGLMIPNLPSPLHYFNFLSIIGQPNAPMLLNKSAILNHKPLNTATVITSVSGKMAGHLNSYDISHDCNLEKHSYRFGEREHLYGNFPNFNLIRNDDELAVNIKITTSPIISHFTQLKLPLFNHWSILCECEGHVQFQDQIYTFKELGSFEYARAINLPYIPLCFFTYQIINLDQTKQLLLAQIRDNFNQIIQSRIYLRNLGTKTAIVFDKNVRFINHRIYPAVTTPNKQTMYLPREFEWQYEDKQNKIRVIGQSRGDYKFGLAAGYVGSFQYQVQINENEYLGEAGYCEYIDCRPLKWQEKNKEEKLLQEIANTVPILLKK